MQYFVRRKAAIVFDLEQNLMEVCVKLQVS